MRTRRRFLAALAGIAFFGNAPAAPEAELWAYWDASDPASEVTVDHGAWDRFLATYVKRGADRIHRVLYGDVSEQDMEQLNAYINRLADVPVRERNKSVQLAYWINLYNALTVKVVLDHYPVQSIKDIGISPGFFSVGPWGKKLIQVEGKELSLDDIEHRILRPIWQDPRIHYAVNCASIGCPNLAREAYTAENAQQLLQHGAVEYINHPRGVTETSEGLVVSSIYDWFVDDFGGTEEGVLEHLAGFGDADLKATIRAGAEIDRYHYDWALNNASRDARIEHRPGS